MDCPPKIGLCRELARVRRGSTVVCNWMNDRELTDLSKHLLLIQIDEYGNMYAAVIFYYFQLIFVFVDLARLKSIAIFAKRYLFFLVIPTWT